MKVNFHPTKAFLFLAALCFFPACSAVKTKAPAEGGILAIEARGGLFGTPIDKNRGDYSQTLEEDILGVRLVNRSFDIPVVFNPEVEKWMRFFTGRGRGHFEIYLERMGAMMPVILPQLRDAGLPADLIFLAMIESGFSTRARSSAGAVGPWQFIRSTGKIYDLQIDAWRDERRDPDRSTKAAIRYLSNLYDEFGDWELACAAYNSGEVRIRNAIQRLNTRDFWTIARHRKALKKETKDYVPKMMAAAIIGKNAHLFGFKYPVANSFYTDVETVRIPKAEDLRSIAWVANIDPSVIKQLNPELSHGCTPPEKNYYLRLPRGQAASVASAISSGELGRFDNFRRHEIRKGDSLSRIARNYRVSKDAILELNELRSASQLSLGKVIILPGPSIDYATKAPRIIASVRRSRSVRTRLTRPDFSPLIYTIRKGDTLYDISRKYSVSIDEIRDWNEISRSKNLQPGRRLKLYVRDGRI